MSDSDGEIDQADIIYSETTIAENEVTNRLHLVTILPGHNANYERRTRIICSNGEKLTEQQKTNLDGTGLAPRDHCFLRGSWS